MSSTAAMAVDRQKIDIQEYLAIALSNSPEELRPLLESFLQLYERKLWHQLTLKLFEFFRHEASQPYRVDVFENFVNDFVDKLNSLRLVELGIIASKEIDNPATQLEFLKSLLERINTSQSPQSHVLLLSTIAHAKLVYGDLNGCREDMETAWKILDNLDGVDPSVNAAYYSVAADYSKAKADYAPYYKNSLLYLACIDPERDLSTEDRVLRAHDLSVSALLADSIYNFGELLIHPILESLDTTPHEWIKKVLFTFNEGNIGKFEALAPLFPKEPILHENFPFLRQKICLMALIESVFKRSAVSRTLPFQTIAEETRLPVNEVEHLVMKALSLGLIRGSLDEVDQTATFAWVQPRVLDRHQIGALAERMKAWTDKIETVEKRVAPEVLANS